MDYVLEIIKYIFTPVGIFLITLGIIIKSIAQNLVGHIIKKLKK